MPAPPPVAQGAAPDAISGCTAIRAVTSSEPPGLDRTTCASASACSASSTPKPTRGPLPALETGMGHSTRAGMHGGPHHRQRDSSLATGIWTLPGMPEHRGPLPQDTRSCWMSCSHRGSEHLARCRFSNLHPNEPANPTEACAGRVAVCKRSHAHGTSTSLAAKGFSPKTRNSANLHGRPALEASRLTKRTCQVRRHSAALRRDQRAGTRSRNPRSPAAS